MFNEILTKIDIITKVKGVPFLEQCISEQE